MPTMAPDQRAALELVLRQGRSYGELADLLGMPEETIRTRARGGVVSLTPPGRDAPERSGEIADWLLGQRDEADAALGDPDARSWTAAVASALRMLPGGESVPELPAESTPQVNGYQAPPPPDDEEPTTTGGGSSRLGGALLIGGAVVLVAAVLAFVLLRDGDTPEGESASSSPSATVTATATPRSLGYIMLKGPAGSKSVGAMQLLEFTDQTVRFALAAQDVAPNQGDERYSLWLTKNNGDAQILGDVQQPVGENGQLASAGPGNEDVDKFPQWFEDYDAIVVSLDDPKAQEPGKVILKGDLHSQQG